MDELEISGKRYISTRRAAKEYGYHSDYIGQLIRGKKLVASKVGRSWYVELESLAQYFGGEGVKIPQVGVVAKSVKAVAPAPRQVVTQQVVVDEQEVVEVEQPHTKKVTAVEVEQDVARDSIHIPVHVQRPSFEVPAQKKVVPLRYVEDDEPYVPMQGRMRGELSPTTVMPRSIEEAEDEYYEEDEPEYTYSETYDLIPKKRPLNLRPAVSLLVFGVVVLVVVFGASVLLNSQTIIEAGKAASAGLSL